MGSEPDRRAGTALKTDGAQRWAWASNAPAPRQFVNTAMKITELLRGKPAPKKVNRGNGGKITKQYVDDVPDLANPISRAVLTQPHLRQRAMPNKKAYNRKKIRLQDGLEG